MSRANRGSCTMLLALMLVEMTRGDDSGVVRSAFSVAVGNLIHRPCLIVFTQRDWMGCLERGLSLFNLPTQAERWALAAKKTRSDGDGSRKRWGDTSTRDAGSLNIYIRRVAKKRANAVRSAQLKLLLFVTAQLRLSILGSGIWCQTLASLALKAFRGKLRRTGFWERFVEWSSHMSPWEIHQKYCPV